MKWVLINIFYEEHNLEMLVLPGYLEHRISHHVQRKPYGPEEQTKQVNDSLYNLLRWIHLLMNWTFRVMFYLPRINQVLWMKKEETKKGNGSNGYTLITPTYKIIN